MSAGSPIPPPAEPAGTLSPLLVTGAGGRLGGRLTVLLSPRFRTIAGVRHAAPPAGVPVQRFDLLDPRSVGETLDATGARSVVHCAALADADACERDPEAARRANVAVCETLARACAARGVRLAALSTDLAFSGERPFWREEDEPRPLSAYGRTKLEGERAILDLCPGAAVVRVALVSGRAHGRAPSATEAIAWALRDGRPLRLFTDQHRTPVDPESIADGLTSLLRRGTGGLFHLGGPERLSRYELGARVAAVLGLDPRPIEPVRQADLPQDGPRPAHVSLASTRLRAKFAWAPRPLDEAIRSGRLQPD
jgi:dTDP-4-dehydrorhamnose reductase